MVGMAIQNSICSPEFSGGVNMVSYGYISSLFPIQVLPAVWASLAVTLGLSFPPVQWGWQGQHSP